MAIDIGLLLLRLVVGLSFMAHGAQKLFGWFGGYGPKGTGGWMESVGIKPGVMIAVLSGLMELVGGLLFAAGFHGARRSADHADDAGRNREGAWPERVLVYSEWI